MPDIDVAKAGATRRRGSRPGGRGLPPGPQRAAEWQGNRRRPCERRCGERSSNRCHASESSHLKISSQFPGKTGQSSLPPPSSARLENEVASLDAAELPQPLAKAVQPELAYRRTLTLTGPGGRLRAGGPVERDVMRNAVTSAAPISGRGDVLAEHAMAGGRLVGRNWICERSVRHACLPRTSLGSAENSAAVVGGQHRSRCPRTDPERRHCGTRSRPPVPRRPTRQRRRAVGQGIRQTPGESVSSPVVERTARRGRGRSRRRTTTWGLRVGRRGAGPRAWARDASAARPPRTRPSPCHRRSG